MTKYVPGNAYVPQPFTLHDCEFNSLSIEDNDLILDFPEGFILSNSPTTRVRGQIRITDVDWDFASVTIYSLMDGFGTYLSEDISIPDFILRYHNFRVEIIDEYYGYHKLLYTGWIHTSEPSASSSFILNLAFFKGQLFYSTHINQQENS